MRVYTVPIKIEKEEKIIGGTLSIRQLLYAIFIGPTLGLIVVKLLFFLPIIIKVVLGLTIEAFFIALGFVKKHEVINLDEYLYRKIKWRKGIRLWN